MRVSTSGAYTSGLSAMQRLQAALDQTQRQISSGRRILTPSDDPIAAARAVEIRESIGRLEQFDRNANVANNQLAQEESALGSVNDVLQRVRELALQANNATQTTESRRLIAIEMRQNLDALIQIANQKDGNGSYLFSGNRDSTQPVARIGTSFAYNGDQGQRFIQIGEGRQVADGDSGATVFFNIKDGNGTFSASSANSNTGTGIITTTNVVDPTAWLGRSYTITFVDDTNYELYNSAGTLALTGALEPGGVIAFRGIELSIDGQPQAGDEFVVSPSRFQDVFSTVDQLAEVLETGSTDPASQAAINNGINAGLRNIDQAIGNILNVRTQVGSRLAAIENQVDSNGAFRLNYQDTLASIEDLDYAEALSRLSLEVTTLEAAQQSFIRTQSLSLFNYF